MTIKACFLFVLALGITVPGAASDPAGDPLISPPITLCLRPLRLAEQPGLPEAVESVKRPQRLPGRRKDLPNAPSRR
jgi:hypothetical protein